MALTCILGDQVISGLLWVHLLRHDWSVCLQVCLKRPLVIRSHFPTPYANKYVHHFHLQRPNAMLYLLIGGSNALPMPSLSEIKIISCLSWYIGAEILGWNSNSLGCNFLQKRIYFGGLCCWQEFYISQKRTMLACACRLLKLYIELIGNVAASIRKITEKEHTFVYVWRKHAANWHWTLRKLVPIGKEIKMGEQKYINSASCFKIFFEAPNTALINTLKQYAYLVPYSKY